MLRLHRAALGRDPDASGLAGLVAARREGVTLPHIAHILAGTAEFIALHGPGAPDDAADPGTTARMACQAFASDDPAAPSLAIVMAGLSRAETAAAIAEAAPVRVRSPLLPGLFPDAPPDDPVAYAVWVDTCEATPTALAPLQGPRVTLAMLAGDSEAEAAIRTLASLQAGAYPDWELCVATRLHSTWPMRALHAAAAEEPRLRLLPAPGADALDALNAALAARTGAVAGLLAPGDILPPTALHEAMQAWLAHPAPRLLYTDEDRIDLGGVRSAPRFKPMYCPHAHRGGIPIGQLALYDAGLLGELGGLRPGPDPHHDLALRAVAQAGEAAVLHVPAVLVHHDAALPPWPTALPPPALLDPLPSVTVILPTKDRPDLLAASSSGVLHDTDYPGLDLLVVDNGSTDPAALALLDTLATTPRVRVLRRPGPFNFSALNNAAAREATGTLLVLLNNDTEMPDPGWLRALVRYAVQPGVGIVGARLLHRDGTLQHGGMVLGPAGRATHVLRGAPRDVPGYEGQLAVTRTMGAVTAACLAIPRKVWDAVGGMDEGLPVAWNDVDLCQRVRAAGLRVLWTPDAVLLHLEGETRGRDAADPARQARFLADAARYRANWGAAADIDPSLNPNLFATDHALVLAPPRQSRTVSVAPGPVAPGPQI